MPIYAKAGPTFKPAPVGAHSAVCCDVVDLGELKVSYAGKDKVQHKIRIVWQIDELRDDGQPFTVSKRYTLSLHEKSSLRKDLESWRGKPFSEEELRGFDIEVLLSVPALVNVIHQPRDGTTYANVTGIMRLPKTMQILKVENYIRVIDRKSDDSGEPPPTDEYCSAGITDDDVPF